MATLLGLLTVVIPVAACGGSEAAPREPKIPPRLAADWASQAESIARSAEAGDSCGAREQAIALQAHVAKAIAAGRVPAAFRRELQSTVGELVQIECVVDEPPAESPPDDTSCDALEARKQELEDEKEQVKEIEDEKERKAQEAEIEAEKKAVEEELKACEEAQKDD